MGTYFSRRCSQYFWIYLPYARGKFLWRLRLHLQVSQSFYRDSIFTLKFHILIPLRSGFLTLRDSVYRFSVCSTWTYGIGDTMLSPFINYRPSIFLLSYRLCTDLCRQSCFWWYFPKPKILHVSWFCSSNFWGYLSSKFLLLQRLWDGKECLFNLTSPIGVIHLSPLISLPPGLRDKTLQGNCLDCHAEYIIRILLFMNILLPISSSVIIHLALSTPLTDSQSSGRLSGFDWNVFAQNPTPIFFLWWWNKYHQV